MFKLTIKDLFKDYFRLMPDKFLAQALVTQYTGHTVVGHTV